MIEVKHFISKETHSGGQCTFLVAETKTKSIEKKTSRYLTKKESRYFTSVLNHLLVFQEQPPELNEYSFLNQKQKNRIISDYFKTITNVTKIHA